ncbi:thioredoxin [Chloroflexota bacterium]
MTSEFIIDVSEADFEYHVITYSQNVPVVVDFWAEWCGPCRVIGPILGRLAEEAQGGFRLAKVNVDENPNLALRYNVRSIPVVKAFKEGKMVAEFVGAQPESKIREFLHEVAPDQSDLNLEKGQSLLEMQQPIEAESSFRQALDISPTNSAALLGLARCLLHQGHGTEALDILSNFPTSKEFASAEKLHPLAEELSQLDTGTEKTKATEAPLDAAFQNSLRLIKRGNIEAAMDGLLDILRENKHYNDGEARRIMVGLLEMLGDNNPITRQYRGELASVLF